MVGRRTIHEDQSKANRELVFILFQRLFARQPPFLPKGCCFLWLVSQLQYKFHNKLHQMQLSLFSEIEIEESRADAFSNFIIFQKSRVIFNLSQPASEVGLSLLVRTAMILLFELGTHDPLQKQGGKGRHSHSKCTFLSIWKKNL